MSLLVNARRCTGNSGDPQFANPFSADWNSRLSEHADATIFHSTEWARVLQDSYGYTPYYFSWGSPGDAKLLCCSEINSWLTGKRAVSLPFADETALLGFRNSDEFERAIREAGAFGRQREWKRIEVRCVPHEWAGPTSGSYYSHEVDLSLSIDTLFKQCSDSTRRAVRKAERAGVTVEIRTDFRAIEEYFELHCLTRKKHGVPPQPLHFFRNIHRHIIAGGFGFTALARQSGRALAGAVFFVFQGKALYKFGASDSRVDHNRPSNLVMWKGIEETKHRGSRNLSFGRTDLHHDGLRRYKLGWGAKEKTIRYLQFDPRSETYLRGKSASSSNNVFQFLPSWLLKRLGSAMYPHLG